MSNKKLIVILGQTAAGKTSFSVTLAKKFQGEVVSADSRQIYKGMNIGTGKITKKEMRGIPHYLLDIVSPRTKFSVAQYQKKAVGAINRIIKKNKVPFLVGGSPFYIYSVVDGWQFPKMKKDLKLRQQLDKKSPEELFKMLKKLAPERTKTIEQKNKRRLVRAIEIAKTLDKVLPLKKSSLFDCLLFGVDISKEELEKRISKRVDEMVASGLQKEVRMLVRKYGFNSVLKESIDYGEWEEYLKGKTTQEKVIERIKQNHLKLSKHQMTWFKKDQRIHWIKNQGEAEKLIKDFLK